VPGGDKTESKKTKAGEGGGVLKEHVIQKEGGEKNREKRTGAADKNRGIDHEAGRLEKKGVTRIFKEREKEGGGPSAKKNPAEQDKGRGS